MKPKQTPHAPQRPIPDASAAREYWIEKIHDLPEVRIEKVRATREALGKNAYESEQILDDTVARMSDDLTRLLESDLESNRETPST